MARDEVGDQPQKGSGEAASEKKLVVVYLAGSGRTGSTLIERILETYDGVCSVGEIGFLWRFTNRGKLTLSRISCPCGTSIADCEHWNAIRRAARFTDGDLHELIDLQGRVHTRIGFLLYFIPFARRGVRARIQRLAVLVERLYRASAEVDSADIVIDASNVAVGALIARHMRGLDLHVKHLVRSPEAVVYSWLVSKYHAGVGLMTWQLPPLRSIWSWWGSNLMVEMLRLVMPVRRYRYEWFARDPQLNVGEMMADVAGFARASGGAFVTSREIKFEPGHAILGNPDRFNSGVISIRPDERYRTNLSWRVKLLVAVLTFPLKIYYGYR